MMLRIPSPQSSPASGRGGNRGNQFRNPDYAPRLRAKQQQDRENAAMAELEQRSAPLFWMVFVAVGLISLGLLEQHIASYLELAGQMEAMVQCINGQAIWLDDAVLRCEVKHYELVAGVKS